MKSDAELARSLQQKLLLHDLRASGLSDEQIALLSTLYL